MLPGLDGLEVCRRIQRERQVPVLMLTAKDSETDLEVGLGVGADDYLTKPFSPRELVARVRALLRRAERSAAPPATRSASAKLVDRPGDAAGDPRRASRAPDADRVRAPAIGSPRRPHVVFGRARLLEEVWGYRDRLRRAHRRLARPRASGASSAPASIRTVHGIGYALDTSGLDVRPLDFLGSIKLKLGVVIVAAVAVTVIVVCVGAELGISTAR